MSPEQREANQESNNHRYRASGFHNQLVWMFAAGDRQITAANVGVGVGVGKDVEAGGVDAVAGVDESGVEVAEASTQKQEW